MRANDIVTEPGRSGPAAAFAAELAMTFVLMSAILFVSNAPPNVARFTGLVAACLVAFYIAVEAPLSGMSLNPARTVASALQANQWMAIWLYFIAPPLGMLTAAALYVRLPGARPSYAPNSTTRRGRAFSVAAIATRKETRMSEHYDAIIVGTGAGGGTLAYKLARSGKKILILERGPFLPREKENWDTVAVMQHGRYHTSETWLDKHGKALHRAPAITSAAIRRSMARRSCGCESATSKRVTHHDGISPKWPLRYPDFEPYYAEAEQLYGVHGEHGSDPTEPWSSEAYPFPPVPHEPRIARGLRSPQCEGLPSLSAATRRSRARRRAKRGRVHPLQHLRWLSVPRRREE